MWIMILFCLVALLALTNGDIYSEYKAYSIIEPDSDERDEFVAALKEKLIKMEIIDDAPDKCSVLVSPEVVSDFIKALNEKGYPFEETSLEEVIEEIRRFKESKGIFDNAK